MKHIVEKFYQAFENLDAEGMIACYHQEIKFENPAFGILRGDKAKNMWRMLCKSQKGKDFKLITSDIEFKNQVGLAHWKAYYTFGKTGRKVHNIVNAKFEFKDGKIINHLDNFDLYRWSRQALGFSGFLMGWTTLFKKKLNAQTNTLLSRFEKNDQHTSQLNSNPAYSSPNISIAFL